MSRTWDFWAKYYDKLWVQTYSLRPTRELVVKEIKEIFQSQMELPQNMPILHLDVGCGIGELIEDLLSSFGPNLLQSIGLDSSTKMIEKAIGKNLPTAEFYVGDAHGLAFSEENFDVITCCHSLPYYADQQLALREFYRVLKAGGYILLINASINNLYDKLIMALVKLTTGIGNYPSKARMVKLLEDTGAEVIKQVDLDTPLFVPNIVLTIARKGAA